MVFSVKLFAIICVVLASAVNGSPVEVAEREPPAQPIPLGNVYFCSDSNFQGICNLFHVDEEICYNAPGDFNDDINSFGPDQGIGCLLYQDYYCGGNSIFLTYPGSADLTGLNFGSLTSSFRCITFH